LESGDGLMTTIVTLDGKGSPLSHAEMDANFTNLNEDKLEAANIEAGTGVTVSPSEGGVTVSLSMHVGPEEPTDGSLLWVQTDA
jgi:hypothetical protein